MKTILKTDLTVRDINEGFVYNEYEGKGLFGWGGKLTIQPEYQRNYIMEEEGIGADPDAEPYDTQTKLNEVPLEDMFDEGEVVVEEVITDDTNN